MRPVAGVLGNDRYPGTNRGEFFWAAFACDLNGAEKLAWGVFGVIPLIPFLYVLTGGGLW